MLRLNNYPLCYKTLKFKPQLESLFCCHCVSTITVNYVRMRKNTPLPLVEAETVGGLGCLLKRNGDYVILPNKNLLKIA